MEIPTVHCYLGTELLHGVQMNFARKKGLDFVLTIYFITNYFLYGTISFRTMILA